jgi:nucleotide-binding universal stress UspA family protein
MLLSGEAATQIAEFARTGGFDLIIMPTHADRFRRMLLGSTTTKVVNDAECPVMTTEHAEEITPRPLEHREWVCAIGLSGDSERVLRLASRAAAEVGAKLSVIHAVRNGDSASTHWSHRTQLDSAEKQEASRRLEELQKTVGSDATVRIAIGPVKEALLDAGRRVSSLRLHRRLPRRRSFRPIRTSGSWACFWARGSPR